MLSSRTSTRRYGAVLLVLTLAAALPVGACSAGGVNFGEGGPFNYDSGTGGGDSGASHDATTDGSPTDTGATDGATPPTTALFVQASPSLPDVRLCWAVNGVVAPVLPFPGDGAMPGSNYPGVPLGGVAAMSDASPLVGSGVTLYALDAENLARIEQGQAASSMCDALVCGGGSNLKPPCLRYNFDYWPVGAIAAGIVPGSDNVVALSGCLPTALDPNASAVLCGSSWTAGNGNLHADVLQLQPTTSFGLGWSVQAAQLSPAMAALEGDGGSALVSFGAEDAAADAAVEVAVLRGEGDLSLQTAVTFEAGLPGYGQLGFAVDVAGNDGGAGHLWMSLADSQQLVDPTVDPTQFFGQPRTYLVAVLGDPNAPHAFAPVTGDAGYDGRGLHVLVVAAPLPGTPEGGAGDGGAGDGEAGVTGDGGAGDL